MQINPRYSGYMDYLGGGGFTAERNWVFGGKIENVPNKHQVSLFSNIQLYLLHFAAFNPGQRTGLLTLSESIHCAEYMKKTRRMI